MPKHKTLCEGAVTADANLDRRSEGPPSRALKAVDSIVAPTSADAAAVIAAVLETISTSGANPGDIDVTTIAMRAFQDLEPEQADHRLREADRLIRENFEVGLLRRTKDLERPESHGSRVSRDRPWFASDASANGSVAGFDEATPGSLRLSTELDEILRQPLPVSTRSTPPALLDAVTRRWCATIEVLSRSGQGAHLALRRNHAMSRELDDLAAYLCGAGLMVRRLTCRSDRLTSNLLRAELHDAHTPNVVIVEGDHLFDVFEGVDNAFGWDAPPAAAGELVPTAFALAAPAWLARIRHVYLWSIPAAGVVPVSVSPFIGGCLGPLAYDPSWSRALVAASLDPGDDTPVSSGAVRALSGHLADPRDAGAMASVARAMAEASSCPLDRSCGVVASSFTEVRPPEPAVAAYFDPRLLVCDKEAMLLLARADAVAENGGRILAWGPPGGGKTTYARALAQAMADGRYVRNVSPGDFLARAWGATERLTRALWRRAADEGEILVIDEFEVVCGAREAGAGNAAYLIRTLTDEWVRAMDDHPDVPLLATCNDVLAVDVAARRRFSCAIHFSDRLSPAQERLAWDVVLATEPPPGWQPVGASVADMAQARTRCRMLGLVEAASLAQAVMRAMEARLGPGRRPNLPASGGKAFH